MSQTQYIKQTKWEHITTLRALNDTLPQYLPVKWALVRAYIKNYDFAQALPFAREIRKWERQNPEIIKALGDIYYSLRQYRGAAAYFQALKNIRQLSEPELKQLANAYLNLEQYEQAGQYFGDLCQINPTYTWYRNNVAWCHIKLNQYPEALEQLQEVVKQSPSDSWAWGKIGYCYQCLDEYEKALKLHLKAEELGAEEKAWNKSCVGWCYLVLGNIKKASEYLKASAKIDIDKISRMNLAHLYLCEGNQQKALKEYKASVENFDSYEEFFEDFDEDYQYLQQYGLSTETYAKVRQKLEAYLKQI